jgi:hypothetical protein
MKYIQSTLLNQTTYHIDLEDNTNILTSLQ